MNARKTRVALGSLLLGSVLALAGGCSAGPLPDGHYLLSLESGSGAAPRIETSFELTTEGAAPNLRSHAVIHNGPERIEVPVVERTRRSVTLGFPHYDSELTLRSVRPADERAVAEGAWRINRGASGVAELPARAVPVGWVTGTRRPAIVADRDAEQTVSGRWAIEFERSGPAVGVFEIDRYGAATGTVLTPTGDYRYLAGRYEPTLREWGPRDPIRDDDIVGKLELSTFDGAHAFAIVGDRRRDGRLAGVFISGSWWAEGWSARKDSTAALPDAFAETIASDPGALGGLIFRDTAGAERAVVDVLNEQGGTVRLVELFGTWCPNCADAADELVELRARYADRGLTVLGVAFEATPDFDRSARQVGVYQDRHGADWPVLIGGTRDKAEATRVFRVLDKVRSYPTILFLNERNEVVAVHTGFSGPATGEAYRSQRARFEEIIEGILGG
ncbi:MAG: hypothetical protein DHS20C14_18300 [Phycisphaeraceae bacterium]|nr:MAG: hypothetical protein DHS20C14_18300 [Phycisphaeraceae bacterium]